MSRIRILAAGAALVVAAGTLGAHDFWVVPDFFVAPEGWTLHVRGQTGESFPGSEVAVTLDRVADARLVGAARTLAVERKARIGTSLVLETPPLEAGDWWVAVALHPRRIDLPAESFNEYLEHEGLGRVLEARREAGIADRPAVERYTKFAKALVRIGASPEGEEPGPGADPLFARPVGHEIEFVPGADPLGVTVGDTLEATLLFRGRPLAGATVLAGGGEAGGAPRVEAETDDRGVARIPLDSPGPWYVKAIHMLPRPDDPVFDYESWWATLTFRLKAPE